MTANEAISATAGGAGAATTSGILAFLASGPVVSPTVFLVASAVGGIAGGLLSSLAEPGPLSARSMVTMAGYGAILGGVIVSGLLWVLGLPPTLQALVSLSGISGALAWSVSKMIPELMRALKKRWLLMIGGPSE